MNVKKEWIHIQDEKVRPCHCIENGEGAPLSIVHHHIPLMMNNIEYLEGYRTNFLYKMVKK